MFLKDRLIHAKAKLLRSQWTMKRWQGMEQKSNGDKQKPIYTNQILAIAPIRFLHFLTVKCQLPLEFQSWVIKWLDRLRLGIAKQSLRAKKHTSTPNCLIQVAWSLTMYFAKELLTLKFITGARCSPGTPETWTSSDGFSTDELFVPCWTFKCLHMIWTSMSLSFPSTNDMASKELRSDAGHWANCCTKTSLNTRLSLKRTCFHTHSGWNMRWILYGCYLIFCLTGQAPIAARMWTVLTLSVPTAAPPMCNL